MSPDLFIQTIFLFVFCLVLAAYETQIEGAAGWAQNLPTWRPSPQNPISRLYRKMTGGRDLTLYHVLVFSLVVVFLHYPYFSGKIWSFPSELTTLSFLFLIIVTWDFLWFIINPKYDFGRFWGRRVLWHKRWFLHMPIDYWFAFVISALLYGRFLEWLTIIALFFVLTLAVIIFAMAVGIFRVKEEFKR